MNPGLAKEISSIFLSSFFKSSIKTLAKSFDIEALETIADIQSETLSIDNICQEILYRTARSDYLLGSSESEDLPNNGLTHTRFSDNCVFVNSELKHRVIISNNNSEYYVQLNFG